MIDFELDHIGIAVENLETGKTFYEALGLKEKDRERVESEKVDVSFFPLGNKANIELLEGLGEDSAITKYVRKRGPGIHHICLRVRDIDRVVAQLKEQGVRLINEEPKLGAHNCRVVFVHPKATGGVLIELSQRGEA